MALGWSCDVLEEAGRGGGSVLEGKGRICTETS